MSGLPEQSEEKWEESLRTIAELSPEHISAYSLIVEPGTPIARRLESGELNLTAGFGVSSSEHAPLNSSRHSSA